MSSKYKENSASKLAMLLITGGMIAASPSPTLAKSSESEERAGSTQSVEPDQDLMPALSSAASGVKALLQDKQQQEATHAEEQSKTGNQDLMPALSSAASGVKALLQDKQQQEATHAEEQSKTGNQDLVPALSSAASGVKALLQDKQQQEATHIEETLKKWGYSSVEEMDKILEKRELLEELKARLPEINDAMQRNEKAKGSATNRNAEREKVLYLLNEVRMINEKGRQAKAYEDEINKFKTGGIYNSRILQMVGIIRPTDTEKAEESRETEGVKATEEMEEIPLEEIKELWGVENIDILFSSVPGRT